MEFAEPNVHSTTDVHYPHHLIALMDIVEIQQLIAQEYPSVLWQHHSDALTDHVWHLLKTVIDLSILSTPLKPVLLWPTCQPCHKTLLFQTKTAWFTDQSKFPQVPSCLLSLNRAAAMTFPTKTPLSSKLMKLPPVLFITLTLLFLVKELNTPKNSILNHRDHYYSIKQLYLP